MLNKNIYHDSGFNHTIKLNVVLNCEASKMLRFPMRTIKRKPTFQVKDEFNFRVVKWQNEKGSNIWNDATQTYL